MPVNKEQTKLEDRETIRTLISSSVKFLDEGNYAQFTELFLKNGRYLLVARSDEIGRDMTWLDMSRDELVALLEESHQHVHDLAERMHIVSVDQILLDGLDNSAQVQSSFAVFRTDTAGNTQVYAVGRYRDSLERDGKDWRIKERCVNVQTRMFRTPTPTPL